MKRLESIASLNRARLIRGHVQIASALLNAIASGANLRIDLGASLTEEEVRSIETFWQRQLTDAISELETARRALESTQRSGKGGKP